MTKYNGHKNWNHWNVSLWVNNDEQLYRHAKACVKRSNGREAAARRMLDELQEQGENKTPDGAPYSVTSLKAAMRGM